MFILPVALHNEIVTKVYQIRGFDSDESASAAHWCAYAGLHGIKTHAALKALHLEHVFGSKAGGARPKAKVKKLDSRFPAVERWDADYKLGQPVAGDAMQAAMRLADKYGIGAVIVDNAFHYLWGGGYVIDAAKKGYIAYTNCSSTLAEVVPFGGKFPTLGTNPHSWAFPTQDAVGFPICIDWATSKIAMGRVQQLAREGKSVPPDCAIDKEGNPTTDPSKVFGLFPFADHKGYGLGLIDELYAAYGGGALPTLRGRYGQQSQGEKQGSCFYFQVTHPEALSSGNYSLGRSQIENIKAVLEDIKGHGNERCLFPGELEANAFRESERLGGIVLTEAEVAEFAKLAEEAGVAFDVNTLKRV